MHDREAPLELKNKNILVTGAAGFIGSHLVRELLRGDNRVTCLVLPGDGFSAIAELNCRIHNGDLLEKKRPSWTLSPASTTSFTWRQ
jgi:nucleoside-diphosphate-sugar epimerase